MEHATTSAGQGLAPAFAADAARDRDKAQQADTLARVQAELKPWVAHNFGDREPWQPLLGIMEEVGELAHAFLKQNQGIHTTEDHTTAIRDAVADVVVFLCDFCNGQGIDLAAQVRETWASVRRRDWAADPASAAP